MENNIIQEITEAGKKIDDFLANLCNELDSSNFSLDKLMSPDFVVWRNSIQMIVDQSIALDPNNPQNALILTIRLGFLTKLYKCLVDMDRDEDEESVKNLEEFVSLVKTISGK